MTAVYLQTKLRGSLLLTLHILQGGGIFKRIFKGYSGIVSVLRFNSVMETPFCETSGKFSLFKLHCQLGQIYVPTAQNFPLLTSSTQQNYFHRVGVKHCLSVMYIYENNTNLWYRMFWVGIICFLFCDTELPLKKI